MVGLLIGISFFGCSAIQKVGYPPKFSETIRIDNQLSYPYTFQQKIDKDVPEYPKTILIIDF